MGVPKRGGGGVPRWFPPGYKTAMSRKTVSLLLDLPEEPDELFVTQAAIIVSVIDPEEGVGSVRGEPQLLVQHLQESPIIRNTEEAV